MSTVEIMNKVTEIKDSYYVTYGVFYSIGVLIFVPQHFLVVATDYWMFKFRDPYRNRPDRPNTPPPPPFDPFPGDHRFVNESASDNSGPANERTPLQASLTSSAVMTLHISLLGFLVIFALCSKRLPPPPTRIKWALFSMLVLFLINTAFTKINTDEFQNAFFALTMVLIVLLSLCSAVTTMSLFELVIKFPRDYYATILSGGAIAGASAALIQIAVMSIDVPFLTRGLIIFSMGVLIIVATTVFYLVSNKKSKYLIYRIGQYEGTTSPPEDTKWSFSMKKLRGALQRTKWFLGAMVFVQGSTAMVHPGMAALTVSTERDSGLGNDWNEIYFVPVVTFLGFHVCDLIGREFARKLKRPSNAFIILTLASLRLVMVPLLMLCNVQPRRRMPVVFDDKFYIILISTFAFTQGYLVNLCIMSVPRVAKKEELEFVAKLLPICSVLSVTLCSAFNLVIISLI